MSVRNTSIGFKVFTLLNTTTLTLVLAFAILPFIHMLAVALSSEVPASSGAVGLIPIGFNVKSFNLAMADDLFGSTISISFIRTLLGTLINLILIILTAYALHFDSKQFPLRKVYAVIFLAAMIFDAGIVPGYILINELNLMNTIWALVLPGALPVFNVLLVMNFFRRLPHEIYETAIIDGAHHVTILSKIFVPLSMASIATVTLFCIVGHWNSWFDGMIFISDVRKQPLQTYLQALISRTAGVVSLDEARRMSEVSQRSLTFARLILAMIPIMLVYPYLQKHFQKGIVLGSIKG